MKRKKVITVLVLGIYLFYALLPLLYSTGSANAEEQAECGYASHSTFQRSILEQNLWLVSSEEQGEHSSTSSRVLLKKKRAIAPSFKEIVAKLFPLLAKSPEFASALKVTFVYLQIPDHTPNCVNGFPYYHSGVSPPSA